MPKTEYIPNSDADFLAWMNNFLTVLNANLATFGLVAADLLSVLFAFGDAGEVLGRVDVNCDQLVDDADLLQVLFNFGSGC